MNILRSLVIISFCVYPAVGQTAELQILAINDFHGNLSQSMNEITQVDVAAVYVPGADRTEERIIEYQVTLRVGFKYERECGAVAVGDGFSARFIVESRRETDSTAGAYVNGQRLCSVPVDEYNRVTLLARLSPSNIMRIRSTNEEKPVPAAAEFVANATTFDRATGQTFSTMCWGSCGTSMSAP